MVIGAVKCGWRCVKASHILLHFQIAKNFLKRLYRQIYLRNLVSIFPAKKIGTNVRSSQVFGQRKYDIFLDTLHGINILRAALTDTLDHLRDQYFRG